MGWEEGKGVWGDGKGGGCQDGGKEGRMSGSWRGGGRGLEDPPNIRREIQTDAVSRSLEVGFVFAP